jgi:hypothetical protein
VTLVNIQTNKQVHPPQMIFGQVQTLFLLYIDYYTLWFTKNIIIGDFMYYTEDINERNIIIVKLKKNNLRVIHIKNYYSQTQKQLSFNLFYNKFFFHNLFYPKINMNNKFII